jgi:hypothetical protein
VRAASRKLLVGCQLLDAMARPTMPSVGDRLALPRIVSPSSFPQLIGSIATDGRYATTAPSLYLPVHTVGSEPVVGDLFIAVLRMAAGGGTATWPSGWTELIDSAADASDDSLHIAYHIVDGLETSSRVVPTTSSALYTAMVFHFRNAGVPVASSVTSATTTTPNPPNCNPAAGSKNYLWMALTSQNDNIDAGSGITNYSNPWRAANSVGEGAPGGASTATIQGVFRELNASQEDPGAFGTMTNANTMSVTIGIPPLP